MKILKITVLVTNLLGLGISSAFAGMALFAPIKFFVDRAALVAVVEVKTVTEVRVSTGEDQASNVYVAEAEVVRTLKSDCHPIPKQRKIAIVGSTIPMSSAV